MKLLTLRHKPRPHVLTNTALGRMRSCERKYYLRNVEGLRSPYRSEAMSIGSAFHAGIEAQRIGAADHYLRAERTDIEALFEDDRFAEKLIVVAEMVRAALDKWSSWPELREVPFRIPVSNPRGRPSRFYDFGGVMDGYPSLDPESFWFDKIGEWKTTGRLSSDYILGLQTKSQPSAYCHAASRLLGRPIRTVVYRIVQKPTIRRRTKQKPETLAEFQLRLRDYYKARPELLYEEHITRTDEQILDWEEEMWEVSKRTHAIQRGTRFPIMNDQSCVGFGRCEYIDLCARSVTEEAFDVVEDFHPELTEAINGAP
jgi:hypothetical protein